MDFQDRGHTTLHIKLKLQSMNTTMERIVSSVISMNLSFQVINNERTQIFLFCTTNVKEALKLKVVHANPSTKTASL